MHNKISSSDEGESYSYKDKNKMDIEDIEDEINNILSNSKISFKVSSQKSLNKKNRRKI